MRISIIGSGALGKTYGGLLALAGHEVHFLMRSDYTAIKEADYFSLFFQEKKATFRIHSPILHQQSHDLPLSDLVIISLKTTANDKLGSLLSSCLKENTIVLIIQNGIGNEAWIAQFTQGCPLICGIASIGAFRLDPLAVHIAFIGNLKLSAVSPSYQFLCDSVLKIFKPSPITIPITIHENYHEIRWQKLAWNVPFGALSLIFNKPTHLLAAEQPYLSIVKLLIREIKAIAKKNDVLISWEYLKQMIHFTQTSQNYFPSIYHDFKKGNEIEKEYIFDNVLKIARKNTVNTPVLILIEKQLTTLLALRNIQV